MPLFWMGSGHKDLKSFPAEVQDEMGYALRDAQLGGRRVNVKVLTGFGEPGVLEVVDDFDRQTYRAVYTSDSRGRYTCGMRSRRNRSTGTPRRKRTWNSFTPGSKRPGSTT